MTKCVYIIISSLDVWDYNDDIKKIPYFFCNTDINGIFHGSKDDVIDNIRIKNAILFKGNLCIVEFALILNSLSELYKIGELLETNKTEYNNYDIINIKYKSFRDEIPDTPDRWD